MSRSLTTLALVAVAVLAAWGWLHFVHDPRVRREAELRAADAVADSLARAWSDSVAAVVARDSVEQARLQAEADSLRQRQPRTRVVTNTVIEQIADTALRDSVMAVLALERAVSDSLQTVTDSLTAVLDSAVAIRTRLLAGAQAVIDTLTSQRDAWRRAAKRSPLGFGCAAGPVVSSAGFAPIGVSCGVVLRL